MDHESALAIFVQGHNPAPLGLESGATRWQDTGAVPTFTLHTESSDGCHVSQHEAGEAAEALRSHLAALPLEDGVDPMDPELAFLEAVATGAAAVTLEPVAGCERVWLWLEGARREPQILTYVIESGPAAAEPIRWRLHLPVPPEKVFAALDSDEGRASFWAESAVEAEGRIDFEFPNGVKHSSEILEREPPHLLTLDYFGGRASFALSSDGRGGTDLELTHEGVAAEEWLEVHAGWLNVLFPLKAWVVHGVDLRSHDPRRSWDEGYVDP